jgi:intein/homing endonuclease
MLFIKKYEKFNSDRLKVGDYVICEENLDSNSEIYKLLREFISNNVGQIVSDNFEMLNSLDLYPDDKDIEYRVTYPNIPPEIDVYFANIDGKADTRLMKRCEILYFSSSKEEMELKLFSMKYNI